MKAFVLKFIDIMIAIVLGLGFQWWPYLNEPWQYAAFFFAYFSIVDYWIDYVPALKKYPPKTEVGLLADILLLFSMFLLIYSAQKSAVYFLSAFAAFRIVDIFWMGRIRYEYALFEQDKIFFNTWLIFEIIEAAVALGAAALTKIFLLQPLSILLLFISFRIVMRILASFKYKKIHFA